MLLRHSVHIEKRMDWAIGVYAGGALTGLADDRMTVNPVLTADDVTDTDAEYVADPFAIKSDGRWYLFFEILSQRSAHGEIGLAESVDGREWEYRGVVLDEPFHLSFPYVFAWGDAVYLVPESAAFGAVRLYRAVSFPEQWEHVATLLQGRYADSAVFRRGGRWWILTCAAPWSHDTLRLFWADSLAGPYREHPRSPVVSGDARRGRPGGRVVEIDGRLVWFAQDCTSAYGRLVRAFEITSLDTARFTMRPFAKQPIVKARPGGWNRHGMHHVDPYRQDSGTWVAYVDGYRKFLTIRIEY
ncbi:MAG: hypothetical protein GF331_25595 [Chitinivibrionales bacterium]|nr:hypothetical protein [Chitinivibrionales bacterium]